MMTLDGRLAHSTEAKAAELGPEDVQRALAYLRRRNQDLEVEQALGLAPYEATVTARNMEPRKVTREPMEMLGIAVSGLGGAFDA
jgi:hypothetical protein